MRTQVCIIGAGPSGLLLSQRLHMAGIDTVVLERKSRAYVMSRIRAGVLEWGSVEMLRAAGAGSRMDAEGLVHEGIFLSSQNKGVRIDFRALTGKQVMVYGQTELTADLYSARDATHGIINDEAQGVTPHDLDTETPHVTFSKDGSEHRIECDFVVGCDGFHGVSRKSIPASILNEFSRVYPFGWLGVLSETPPVSHELIYAGDERGFALCSMRNPALSRYYIQVPLDDRIDKWPDRAFWDELKRRIPEAAASSIITGASVEKSIAPLRSYVAEPMQWGRLFLVGDAAHIVPQTGAKGLNLAFSDVHYLHHGLVQHYGGDDQGIETYSASALTRVWKAVRFSWWMTRLLHRFPEQGEFDLRIQKSELAYLEHSTAAQTALAENYVGLPY